jgi:acyl-coenzyme A synthetase/AMP-(fatty) acid ligase
MRRRLLDIAVFIARHIVDHWWSTETASTHLRTAVDAGRPRIGMKGDTEDQLCVPAVKTKWAWCSSRSTVAVAKVLGMIWSNPEGWMLEVTATLRRS